MVVTLEQQHKSNMLGKNIQNMSMYCKATKSMAMAAAVWKAVVWKAVVWKVVEEKN